MLKSIYKTVAQNYYPFKEIDMKKVVYLPLDERPCNYSYVGFLCEDSEKFNLVRPDLSEMGNKKLPANYEGIKSFLLRECADADYLVIAVDTLLYGGIVPSRLHYLTKEELGQRLSVLKTIKEMNPDITVYAFGLVMRCPCYSDNDEEPEYYGKVGLEIFEYGQNEHKYRDGLISEADYLSEKERLKVCLPYLDDYITRRSVNISVFADVLGLVGNVIDEFVILQDDSNPCGFTAMDQEFVRGIISKLGISVDIYPGADEGGLTLLARTVANMEKYSPKIYPVYPKEECKKIIPLYEDRAIERSIASQIKSAGATLCESEEDADILLFVNVPVGEMQNVMKPEGKQYDDRDLPAFINRIKTAYEAGRGVAVADVAYLNGGDKWLTSALMNEIGLLNLWGYAGWNTSSNTLGTVICQAIMRYFYGDTAAHRRFTAQRIFEDIGYQAKVRKHVWDNEVEALGGSYHDTKEAEGVISRRIQQLINEFMNETYPEIANSYYMSKCYMPWVRMFEIGIVVAEK